MMYSLELAFSFPRCIGPVDARDFFGVLRFSELGALQAFIGAVNFSYVVYSS